MFLRQDSSKGTFRTKYNAFLNLTMASLKMKWTFVFDGSSDINDCIQFLENISRYKYREVSLAFSIAALRWLVQEQGTQ